MPKQLKIILWVTIGLLAAFWPVAMGGYWQELGILKTDLPFTITIQGHPIPVAVFTILGLICACGILIVYWTKKSITLVALKRYLLLTGASAIGMLFFAGPVHIFTEFGFVMATIVCPAALVTGLVLSLRYKSNDQASC